jgi:hypothetical protein
VSSPLVDVGPLVLASPCWFWPLAICVPGAESNRRLSICRTVLRKLIGGIWPRRMNEPRTRGVSLSIFVVYPFEG